MGKYRVVMLKTVWPDTKVEEKILNQVDAELVVSPSPDEDTVIQQVGDADAILTVLDKVTDKILAAAPKCKVVVRIGIGVDNIDILAATKRGMYVANVPDYCIDEVSDHTIALVLDLQRNIAFFNQAVRRGEWRSSKAKAVIPSSRGKTYGVVGLGNIGRAVAKKVQVFGFRVIATDPFVSPEEAKKFGVELADFNKLLEISDVISIHAPLLESTHHMFNEETIGKMKNTAYLVNVARGGLIDEKALYNALKAGKLAGAAIDVTEQEPAKGDEPLLALDNLIITPHVAAFSEVAMLAVREKAFAEVVRVLQGGQPKNWVNREEMVAEQKGANK